MDFLNNLTINIDKLIKYTCLKQCSIEELDINYLICLYLSNEKPTELLDIIKNQLNNDFSIKHFQKNNLGRFYSEKKSIVNLPKKLKHSICRYHGYIDIDMKNAGPTIIYEVFNKAGYQLKGIKHYLDNREDVLYQVEEHYNVSRSVAKDLFIRLSNSGTFKGWLSENNIVKNKQDLELSSLLYNDLFKKLDVIENFETDIKFVTNEIKKYNNPFVENKDTLFYWYCIIENHILYMLYKTLISLDYFQDPKKIILEYDGLMFIPTETFLNKLNDNIQKILNEINAIVYSKTNINIKFDIKDFDDYFHISNDKIEMASMISMLYSDLSNLTNVNTDLNTSELYKEYKKDFEQYFFQVDNPISVFQVRDNHVQPVSIESIKLWLSGKYKDFKGNFLDTWLNDENKRRYTKIVFDPSINNDNTNNDNTNTNNDNTNNVFNIFTNYILIHHHNKTISYDDIKDYLFIKIVKHIFDDKTDYFLDWISHLIQYPYIKTNVAVILYSDTQGIGKGIILEYLLKLLNPFCGKIESIEDIDRKFNSNICYKILIYGDEIMGTSKTITDKIKNSITKKETILEYKGKDPIMIKDYTNYYFATNNEIPFKIDVTDRRFLMIDCSNKKLDTEFYNNLSNELNTELSIINLFSYFKNRNIKTEFNDSSLLMTEYKQRLIFNNYPAYIKMLFSDEFLDLWCNIDITFDIDENYIVNAKSLPFKKVLKGKHLYESSIEYARKRNLTRLYTPETCGKGLSKYLKLFKYSSNGSAYILPNKEIMLNHLKSVDPGFYNYCFDI